MVCVWCACGVCACVVCVCGVCVCGVCVCAFCSPFLFAVTMNKTNGNVFCLVQEVQQIHLLYYRVNVIAVRFSSDSTRPSVTPNLFAR